MEEKKLFSAITQMSPDIYREFYKFYYRRRYKKLSYAAMVVAAAFLIGAFFAGRYHADTILIIICLIGAWISLFFTVYRFIAHRRPLKRDKNKKQTTRFSFYEDYVEEKTNGETSKYEYSKLMQVIEKPKLIYIYHAIDSVSIVNKYNVKNSSDELCALLRSKTVNYKKVS